MLITIEGIDAAGKHTQSEKLKEHFEKIGGLNVTKFDLPRYESVTGEMIKDHLKGKWHVAPTSFKGDDSVSIPDWEGLYTSDPSTYVFQCVQLVNRMETLPDGLWNQRPNDVFIADRYNTSAYAYGAVFGLDLDWLLKTHRHLPQPDLSIFLDITVEESFNRRPERRDSYERNVEMLNNVRSKYLELFERLGPSYVVVDASGAKEQTFEKIVREVHRITDNNELMHFSEMF